LCFIAAYTGPAGKSNHFIKVRQVLDKVVLVLYSA